MEKVDSLGKEIWVDIKLLAKTVEGEVEFTGYEDAELPTTEIVTVSVADGRASVFKKYDITEAATVTGAFLTVTSEKGIIVTKQTVRFKGLSGYIVVPGDTITFPFEAREETRCNRLA